MKKLMNDEGWVWILLWGSKLTKFRTRAWEILDGGEWNGFDGNWNQGKPFTLFRNSEGV